VIGGAFWAPLIAYGHGLDCVQAKLSLEGRRVILEIVADYGVNPLIADEAEARTVLADCLELSVAGKRVPLRSISPLSYTADAQFDPASPLPAAVDDDGHKLVGARWEWHSTEETLRFHVPAGSIHNVLLWQKLEKPRWTMMLGDDDAPALHLTPESLPTWILVALMLAGLAGLRWALPPQHEAESRQQA
jgi:hypothetical protein